MNIGYSKEEQLRDNRVKKVYKNGENNTRKILIINKNAYII